MSDSPANSRAAPVREPAATDRASGLERLGGHEDAGDEWTGLRQQIARLANRVEDLASLMADSHRQQASMSRRVEDLASLMTDSYHHQMSMLRRIHNCASIYPTSAATSR